MSDARQEANFDPKTITTILFPTWYRNVKHYADFPPLNFTALAADETTGSSEVVQRMRDVEKTGAAFPGFGNFADTLTLCDQFMAGRAEPELLAKVAERAARDVQSIAPYARAFADKNQGHGFGMPMLVMVFGYPAQLADYIQKNSNPDGLVSGLSPTIREGLRQLTARSVSAAASGSDSTPSPSP